MKYVVVTGGVVSGLGKGITASSVGLLLKECGLRVTAIKIDPYLNIDAGTMSPYEHGEVFVLDDGGEVDLDLGNYERFMSVTLTRDHNITTGKVYSKVISKEREGAYLGKTVQMIPHITDEIQDWIARVANIEVISNESKNDESSNETNKPQICIIELGGTVGDIESSVFLEALRQFEFRVGRDNFCHIHVSLIPVLGNVGEQKSKPTQHSMQSLRASGLIPNIIVCRCKYEIDRSIKEKVSLFSMVPFSHVISVHDVSNIYFVPNLLLKQGVVSKILDILKINKMPPMNIGKFDQLALKLKEQSEFEKREMNNNNNSSNNNINNNNNNNNKKESISIGIVGKYTGLSDSYLSVTKALLSASLNCDLKLKIVWIESSHLEYYDSKNFKNVEKKKKKHKSKLYVSKQNRKKRQTRSRSSSAKSMTNESNESNESNNSNNSNNSNKSDEAPPHKRQRIESVTSTSTSKSISTSISRSPDNSNNNSNNNILNSNNKYLSYLTLSNVSSDCETSLFEFSLAWNKLCNVDGILIPGGFGDRGIEGKIAACKYARTNGIPFLGICLGMQMAVIEFARNVCMMSDCNSEEVDSKCENKCVIFMPEMIDQKLGGTMRLGKRVCHLSKDSLIHWLYNGNNKIYERHRHRYEVNPSFINIFEKHGLLFTGKDDLQQRMEVIELNTKQHPFYLACQFHPEFKSNPLRPSPPFTGLIKAASGILHNDFDTDNENENENENDQLFSIDSNEANSEMNELNEIKTERKNGNSNVLSEKGLNVNFENDDKQSETPK